VTQPNREILLVDDNAMDIELTLEAFAEEGLGDQVVVVRSGGEALKRLIGSAESPTPVRGTLPSLVLLDLKMPEVDGFEVLRCLKATPGLRRLPIVVLTSSHEEGDVRRAFDLGANSYVVKPVAFAGFLEVVRALSRYWLEISVRPHLDDAPSRFGRSNDARTAGDDGPRARS
jgi:CheY-like chemotaxis protein